MSCSFIYEIVPRFNDIEDAINSSIEVRPEDVRWLVSTVDRVMEKENVLSEHIEGLISDFNLNKTTFKENNGIYKVTDLQVMSEHIEDYCLKSLKDCNTYINSFLSKDRKGRSYSAASYELATMVYRGSGFSIFGVYEGSWIDIINAYELLDRIRQGYIKEIYITGVYEYHL
jgi:hypothetical protein